MLNSLRILRRDLLRLIKVPAAWVVIVGLSFIPSLYAWFNIVGFWDPYGNTSHIRVAVANSDRGAELPSGTTLNIGDQLEAQLKENDQMGWHFVTSKAALQEVRTGQSYAALIIPPDFSQRLTAVLSGHIDPPKIKYYVNEKANAVAPKITGTGATTVDERINASFASVVSKTVAEKIDEAASSIIDKTQEIHLELNGAITKANTAFTNAANSLNEAGSKVSTGYAKVVQARHSLASFDQAAASSQNLLADLEQLTNSARTDVNALPAQVSTLGKSTTTALNQAADKATQAANTIDSALAKTDTQVDTVVADLAGVNDLTQKLLEELQKTLPTDQTQIQQIIADIEAHQKENSQLLGNITTLSSEVSQIRSNITQLVRESAQKSQAFTDILTDTHHEVTAQLPQINQGLNQVDAARATLGSALSMLQAQKSTFDNLLTQVDKLLDLTQNTIGTTQNLLHSLEGDMEVARTDLQALSSSSLIYGLAEKLQVSPAHIAEFMQSPTQLETKPVFPVAAYGSAMAPFLTSLALWIGAFALVVIIRLEVSKKGIQSTKPLTYRQRYYGRLMLLSIFCALQATIVSIGNLVIGVQVVSTAAYIFTNITVGLVYLSIIYALSTTFQHVGKGLCVVLLIIQIPGASGLYPIEMMPGFFRCLYPFFPFTYGINAAREVVGGFYGSRWGHDMGILFAVAALACAWGVQMRPYLVNLNRLFSKQLLASGMIQAEKVQSDRSRYRLTQILHALSNHQEYREVTTRRAQEFIQRYPRYQRRALAVAMLVFALLILGAVTRLLESSMVIALIGVGILGLFGVMIALEYLRDSVERSVSLAELSDEDLRGIIVRKRLGGESQ